MAARDAMTYNFDVDKWYERQRHLLDARLASGEITRERFAAELDDLERRFEQMAERLDGTFQIPGRNQSADER